MVTPRGFVDTKPTEWVLYVTRSYRMVANAGVPLFLPAPPKRLHRYTYGPDGLLRPTSPPSPRGGTGPADPAT